MTIPGKMFRLVSSLALAFATTNCRSQEPKAYSYSGQVVNSVTGEPISRALVQLGSQHGALTDHNGNFEFDDVVEDGGAAYASKPGYFPKDSVAITQSGPVILRLIPEAIVSGTVTDQNGQPIQDLPIHLKSLDVRNGLTHWRQIQSTTTNVEGEFRFAELQAGKYRLASSFQTEGFPEAASSVAFVPVDYPPVGGDEANGALTLSAGDHVEANMSPASEKLYPVTGVVHGRAGRGMSFEVETKDGEPVSPVLRLNRETGKFQLMLASGSYRLKVHSFVEPQQWSGTREISVEQAAIEGVSITLQPLATIPVEIGYQSVNTDEQNAHSSSPPSLVLALESNDAGAPYRMYPALTLSHSGGGQRPESDDPLIIRDVEPGRYAVQAHVQAPWYVASVSCGNVDLTREPLVMAAGAPGCTMRATLRNDSASVKWSITSNDTTSASRQANSVLVIPLSNLTQEGYWVFSTAEGSFEGLAPGRYLVMAMKHQQELPYRNAEALQRYFPFGQEVTLTPNGKAEMQLQLFAGEP